MKYPFEVYRMVVDGHSFWAAESKALKGCVAQGDTQEEALEELKMNEAEWLETAKEYGIEIPAVPVETEETYSGKFTVRMSAYVHRVAAELAKKLNVSLNQYVNDAIVNYNAEIRSSNYISDYVARAAQDMGKDVKIGVSYSIAGSRSDGLPLFPQIKYIQEERVPTWQH